MTLSLISNIYGVAAMVYGQEVAVGDTLTSLIPLVHWSFSIASTSGPD